MTPYAFSCGANSWPALPPTARSFSVKRKGLPTGGLRSEQQGGKK